MLNIVETDGSRVRTIGESPPAPATGVRVEQSPREFVLSRHGPGSDPVFYRVGYGRLEWGTDLSAFLDEEAPQPPDPGLLLALVHGAVLGPESTLVPATQRLAVGTSVRVGPDGVNVGREPVPLPPPDHNLVDAVIAALGDVHAEHGEYAIAYSGGLASSFLAAAAVRAGRRPALSHADLGQEFPVPPDFPGLEIRPVRADPAEILDHQAITGAEPFPLLPDTEAPCRLIALLTRSAGRPLVSGGLLSDLVSIRLHEAGHGVRGWRLLGCEPFHTAGTLRDLGEARKLMAERVVFAPGLDGSEVPREQPAGTPRPPSPPGGAPLPGLTPAGQEAFVSSQRGMLALWKDHLETVDPTVGRLVAGLEEHDGGNALLPALDPRVMTAAAALRPSDVGRIRHGVFQNHLPLRRLLNAHRTTGVRHSAAGHWLRLAAASYLCHEREKVVAQLTRECALADLGLIEPAAICAVLRDGRELAEQALPLLRLIWVDQWMRGRS